MGRALVRAVASSSDLRVAGASEAPGSPALHQDAGTTAGLPPLGLPITADPDVLLQSADAVIDFTLPQATVDLVDRCARKGLPVVVGTTGLDAAQREALYRAAERIPIVFAPNMSVGVNVLLRLAADAARLLGPEYAFEIVEAHHDRKVDAPSGTALRLAQVLAEATREQGSFDERICYGRQGIVGPRPPSQIGVHAVRAGDIVGEHTVMCCASGERLELVHRASSRETFARGALRALRWATTRLAGLYDMQDVLGLGS
jgi:4-hydroxy-tetrahydrodipicolinate reductase